MKINKRRSQARGRWRMEVTGPQQNTFTDCPYVYSPSDFPPLEPLLPAHIIARLDDSILFHLAALASLISSKQSQ